MPNQGPANTITRSATQFIVSALRLVGALRSGNNLSNSELTDSKQVLNDLLDSWSAQRCAIYQVPYLTLDQNGIPFTLVASKQSYILGNTIGTEDFLTPRPPRLERVSLMYSASQSTPVEVPLQVFQESQQWQGISNKSTTSLLPQVVYIEKSFPDMVLWFWPIPTQANPIVLYPWSALTQFPDLTSQFQFPPAYARALRFNLAVDLAAEFPCDMTKLQLVMKLAAQSKREVKSLNAPMLEAYCDPALVGANGPRGNIFTGSPSRSHNY